MVVMISAVRIRYAPLSFTYKENLPWEGLKRQEWERKWEQIRQKPYWLLSFQFVKKTQGFHKNGTVIPWNEKPPLSGDGEG